MKNKKFIYKKLSEIQKEKDYLNYSDYLSTIEWKNFRLDIIKRDKWHCQKCGALPNSYDWILNVYSRKSTDFEFKHTAEKEVLSTKKISLNVHHKYYIEDYYPWEYKNEALITVCNKCHTEIHKNETIKIYENEVLEKPKTMKNCEKCSGTGYLEEYHYFMNGVCFDCNGKGYMSKLENEK